MSIASEFGQFEPCVKEKVRIIRNDTPGIGFENAEMGIDKKTTAKRRTTWFVREWLAAKGLKQRDLVEGTNYTKSQVSEYVNGVQRFNEDVLKEFARVIGVDMADLLRSPETPPTSVNNEIVSFLMRLKSDRQKRRALRLLEAIADDDGEAIDAPSPESGGTPSTQKRAKTRQ